MVPELIGPILADYVDRAHALLISEGRPPGRVLHVVPGMEVAWDDCCDGQLWGRVVAITPHVGQNNRGTALPCGVLFWNVTFALGIVRCVHTVDDDGQAPSVAEIEGDGQTMLNDLAALQQIVLCHPETSAILGWNPLGPLGGCAGGEWSFRVRIDVCPCPET